MKRALWILIAAAALGCGSEKKAGERYEDALRLADNGERAAAADSLLDALKHQPDHSAANSMLGRLYLEKGDAAEAIPLLKRAAGDETYLERHAALQHLGEALGALGRYNEAAAALTKSIALHETDEPLYSLARVLAQAGDMDGAALALREAIRLNSARRADFAADPVFQRFRATEAATELLKGGAAP